jgi:hypothetical protein
MEAQRSTNFNQFYRSTGEHSVNICPHECFDKVFYHVNSQILKCKMKNVITMIFFFLPHHLGFFSLFPSFSPYPPVLLVFLLLSSPLPFCFFSLFPSFSPYPPVLLVFLLLSSPLPFCFFSFFLYTLAFYFFFFRPPLIFLILLWLLSPFLFFFLFLSFSPYVISLFYIIPPPNFPFFFFLPFRSPRKGVCHIFLKASNAMVTKSFWLLQD